MRQKIVAGNWKMHKTAEETEDLLNELINKIPTDIEQRVIVAPTFINLAAAADHLEFTNIEVAAQNMHQAESGAFTGETSAGMLASFGATYVIIGHSERREYFKESNQLLTEKTKQALANGLTPIFCCGEPLEIREAGTHEAYVKQQLTESLFEFSSEEMSKIVIAYEPIWAIGTGKTATADQAQEMHLALRRHIASKYGKEIAEATSILYGGSANPGNAKELFSKPDVDGGLIGGASLKSRDFVEIVKSF